LRFQKEELPHIRQQLFLPFGVSSPFQFFSRHDWESGSMKTLAAHGLAGGIVQDRMGGSFGAGFLSGSLGSYLGSSSSLNKYLNAPVCAPFANLPPPITEMVPPTTASLAVLPILEFPDEPR
jgi:hypothetical protein